jgi:hypothetical protein
MSFLLLLMSFPQENYRRGQNKFCLEARGVGEKGREQGAVWRNGPNNVYIYE